MSEPSTVDLQKAARYVADWCRSDWEMLEYFSPSPATSMEDMALSFPAAEAENLLEQWNEAVRGQRARRDVYAAARASYDREFPPSP